jgi:hypothetical protein
MRLVQTVPDETMIVTGFEHHIFNCPSCHDEERRLVFVRQSKPLSPPIQTESAPIQTEGMDQDLVDATLQLVGQPAAANGAPQESSSVRSGKNAPGSAPAFSIACLPAFHKPKYPHSQFKHLGP